MFLHNFRFCLVAALLVVCAGFLTWNGESVSAAQSPSGSLVRLLQSDSERVVLQLDVAGYDARQLQVDTGTFSLLSIPDVGTTFEVGKPQVPVKGVLIGIPLGAQASLKILDDQSRRDTLAQPPLPAPKLRMQVSPTRPAPRSAGRSFAPDAVTFSANQFYPASAARIASVGTWRSQRYLAVEFYPLQVNPAGRQLLFHKSLRVEVTFKYPDGVRAATFGQSVEEGPFESVLRAALLNYDSSKNWRAKSVPAARIGASRAAVYPGGPWYRVAVNADGIYKIVCNQLPAGIDPATIRIFKQDNQLGTKRELAINVVGSDWTTCDPTSHYLEFFGQAANGKYTDTNIYWLTFGERPEFGPVQRMAVRDGNGTGTLQTIYTDTLHLEKNDYYVQYAPQVEGFEHWYWNYMAGGWGVPSQDHSFQLDRFSAAPVSATLQIDLVGVNKGSHHTLIKINGTLIDDTTWPVSGRVERRTTIAFDQSLLHAGANKITVIEPDVGGREDPDIPVDYVVSNYFDLSYPASFKALGDILRFRQPSTGATEYQIGYFASSTLRVFDITNPFTVARLDPVISISTPCPCTLRFADTIPDAPHEYLALSTGQYKTPLSIQLDTPSNLHDSGNAADYIVIASHDFVENAGVLADFRRSQGLRVPPVVDVQDIYDEFSDGTLDPQAIRDFLYYAYANWQRPAPSFVVLVGDGTYDPKGYCTTPGFCIGEVLTPPNSTFIPPFLRMVDPWVGEVASDNRFVSFHDNDASPSTMPEMSIGRLPARSQTEVTVMVNKIKNYEQNPPSPDWKYHAAFVADNPYYACGTIGDAGDFWNYSDGIALNPVYMPGLFTTNRIYYNPCPDLARKPYSPVDETRNAIQSAMNDGNVFISYIGHASFRRWSNDNLLTVLDVPGLKNNSRLPIMLEMACYTGDFTWPNADMQGLAETMVRAEGRGALASWAATGQGVTEGHDLLEKGFFNAVMWQGVRQLGPATVLGKAHLWANGAAYYGDLIDTFILIGDPASRLSFPPLSRMFLPMISR